jgi:hypothetical protein
MTRNRVVLTLTLTLLAAPLAAQSMAPSGRATALDFSAGYAGFVDDATIDHAMIGAAARVYMTRRLSIGPEVVFMRGPGSDRDLFLTGNLTYDMVGERGGRPPRVVPYWVVGGGLGLHQARVGRQGFRYTEGALTGGGGVRVWVNDRVSVAGDLRLGWELHTRVAASVGIALGR